MIKKKKVLRTKKEKVPHLNLIEKLYRDVYETNDRVKEIESQQKELTKLVKELLSIYKDLNELEKRLFSDIKSKQLREPT